MPKKSEFPKPSKRFVSGAWVILWRYSPAAGQYKQYTVSTGLTDKKADELTADIILRRFAVALAQTPPEFPSEYAATSGVRRYLEDRNDTVAPSAKNGQAHDPSCWLHDYEPVIKKECAKQWARDSLSFLKSLDEFVPGGIGNTDSFHATRFLEHVHKNGASKRPRKNRSAEDGKSNGTRNRIKAACSRFFRWCVESGRTTENPFKGIKSLKEDASEEIVYCTARERERVIAAAKATGNPDWIAVPIAFYAGCRREEIFTLEWNVDINFESKRLKIRGDSKTGARTTPIAKELLAILEEHRKERGFVIPRHATWTWENQADRLIEAIRENLCLPEHPTLAGMPRESRGKRQFLMTENDIAGDPKRRKAMLAAMEARIKKLDRDSRAAYNLAADMGGYELTWAAAHDGGEWIPAERIGWNAFRHTFASLRAQAGVSLDKISSWMGNSPKVCRKHYAQFMPRDVHDEDIDKL